ncbi:MAG: 3,5-diaminohexanoate dehydrogenase [uncultured Nocardioidaceae bacterium]|uniref:3,5-diaminohexanoate dehydrogenase n=1 Tax=uncultured Nocardioidaceae bacterium TaxID=253824 RepID=A0A6J4LAE5_9ACTN|nr:MAG: 3,5-diaminohexanoate dehydrogenase [uncultured Nocardioidaceae bacterium]
MSRLTAAATSDPLGLHRVLEPPGVLPQAAARLDTRRELWPDEVRVRVERLNLDAASFRQLERACGGDGARVRAAVREIVEQRGKMQNPETGSGGMLVGTVEEVGDKSGLGLRVGDRIATLVSLTLTPLVLEDGLAQWDGRSEQVPTDGYAILFGRSIVARLPDDLPAELALAVMDVCGAPALTDRVVRAYAGAPAPSGSGRPAVPPAVPPVVVVIGGAGKSGSLALAAARRAGAGSTIGVVPSQAEADLLLQAGLADHVVLADARDPLVLRDAVAEVAPDGAHVTVVCVDVPGCEGGAILATRDGGTVIFFSMATSFPTAALSAEGLVADVTMLIGNGYLPGHADQALSLLRGEPAVRRLFERRL